MRTHSRVPTLAWRVVRRVLLVLIFAFIAIPMVVVVWTSFQPDTYPQLPPGGLSLKWWQRAMTAEWLRPLAFSAQLAAGSALIATVLGSIAAYGLATSKGKPRAALDAFLATPLLLPEIVIGLGVIQFVSLADARALLGSPALLLTHSVLGIPFVVRTVGVSLVGIEPAWDRAARDLGATPLQAFRLITLPLMRSGMFAGALFAFIMSFNSVELSLFLASSDAQPLPIKIMQFMEFQYSPTMASVAVVSVVAVAAITAVTARFVRITDFIYGGKK